ncbi:leucyl/phenylalanyl-tRNA--protein transferase [Luteimonas sp. MC1825]|uniref:leucyl/phenylalanyl-tRNA--protein transferase n=1 Tax=Luteimonas sp. MC1825 TaxID=2761107 RepID=UPI00160FC770|nr:leucyl/phenylalanyl-tRNA--protein transferase [Luteimonas sp. MC1825]MBB6599303.1 leucyl/phenylalanyl-tRNA--protein transferase [Luteimonas sp. MC1825]QOC87019.1 leucyl/phenylalanyl-tRNA--protein transferase [Luteimonas sp. MC1825]
MSLSLPRLGARADAPFPEPGSALREPDGLLAFGGDLSTTRLANAYRRGIFPWYSEGQPILWWSPDPRMVFRTDGVHLASRFRRSLRHSPWHVRADTAFDAVVAACADVPRHGQRGTWIDADMRAAYGQLHRAGLAHSIEVVDADDRLVGGMYGVAIGAMFFGESMFSAASGGSKLALAALALRLREWGWPLIDAQVDNAHLRRMGAETWPRVRFLGEVRRLVAYPGRDGAWTDAFGELPATALAAPPDTARSTTRDALPVGSG